MRDRSLIVFGAAVVSACASASMPAPATGVDPRCVGQNVAIVSNNAPTAVDIRAYIPSSGLGSDQTLGTLGGGQQSEFKLPAGTTRVYSASEGLRPDTRTAASVRIRYECRP